MLETKFKADACSGPFKAYGSIGSLNKDRDRPSTARDTPEQSRKVTFNMFCTSECIRKYDLIII